MRTLYTVRHRHTSEKDTPELRAEANRHTLILEDLIEVLARDGIQSYFADGMDALSAGTANNIVARLAQEDDVGIAGEVTKLQEAYGAIDPTGLPNKDVQLFAKFAQLRREGFPVRYEETEHPDFYDTLAFLSGELDSLAQGDQSTARAAITYLTRYPHSEDRIMEVDATRKLVLYLRDREIAKRIERHASEKSMLTIGALHDLAPLRELRSFRLYALKLNSGIEGFMPEHLKEPIESVREKHELPGRINYMNAV